MALPKMVSFTIKQKLVQLTEQLKSQDQKVRTLEDGLRQDRGYAEELRSVIGELRHFLECSGENADDLSTMRDSA